MDVTPCRLWFLLLGRVTIENQYKPLGGWNAVGESLGCLLH